MFLLEKFKKETLIRQTKMRNKLNLKFYILNSKPQFYFLFQCYSLIDFDFSDLEVFSLNNI